MFDLWVSFMHLITDSAPHPTPTQTRTNNTRTPVLRTVRQVNAVYASTLERRFGEAIEGSGTEYAPEQQAAATRVQALVRARLARTALLRAMA